MDEHVNIKTLYSLFSDQFVHELQWNDSEFISAHALSMEAAVAAEICRSVLHWKRYVSGSNKKYSCFAKL
jgi:hypothetical protein